MSNNPPMSGVIWLTGYSAAGKTSVARVVTGLFRGADAPSIHLDGDDLRAILGGKWGYSAEERRELARAYFRLCSHIAAQNVVVVISAVAMYNEVYDWFKQNIPHAMLVYLDVPEDVRRRRDQSTKRVYSKMQGIADQYEVPQSPDLTLRNDDGADLAALAQQVVEDFGKLSSAAADRGKGRYWDSFYARRTGVLEPSPFAVHVRQLLGNEAPRLLEVGCGNGRDSSYFARSGCTVTALDTSEAAIAYCHETHGDAVSFVHGPLAPEALDGQRFDVVYSRFVLHAMTPEEEAQFIRAAAASLDAGGRLIVECRSIHDPLARKGEVLSPTERIEGHYRRFIVADELSRNVAAAGFEVESLVESNGLAVFGDEDPVVIRLVARKAG